MDCREQLSSSSSHVLHFPVKYVVINFPDTTCPQLPGLPPKHIPVYPIKGTFRYYFDKRNLRKSISIQRTQLPLDPGFSYTAHKTQGKTLPSIIVDLVPVTKHLDPSFAYVPLSRVRRFQDLLIMRPFDKRTLHMKRNADFVAQEKRFQTMDSL